MYEGRGHTYSLLMEMLTGASIVETGVEVLQKSLYVGL